MKSVTRIQIARLFLLTLAINCYSGVLLAGDDSPIRVVYDVAVDSPEAVNNVLARASHMSNITGADPLEGSIVLVLHGNEVMFFAKDDYETYRSVVDRAKNLSVGGIIRIKVSELALKVRGMSGADVHEFIEIIPFGDAEIARLQTRDKHAYLKAHNLAP